MGRAAVDDQTLTLASGGAAVTTLTRGSVITLTATVTAGTRRNAGSSGLLRCGGHLLHGYSLARHGSADKRGNRDAETSSR